MPRDRYIQLDIDGKVIDLDPNGQVPLIDYALEDEVNFEQKKSAEAFNIELPATLANAVIGTTNPSEILQKLDMPMPARMVANGYEVLIGKMFFQGTGFIGGKPSKYKGKIYGLNGDWVIDLKEKTLFDFLNPTPHQFEANVIEASWNFDGRTEAMDYVYAPVRYRKKFGEDVANPLYPDLPARPDDSNVIINDLKPSLSVYWFLYRAFRSVGYRLVSQFMDTDFYRRGTLPWTWGGFDYLDDTRWEPLKFLAGGVPFRETGDYNDFPNMQVATTRPGYFENTPGTFMYAGPGGSIKNLMVWKYPTGPVSLGKVRAGLSVKLNYAYKASLGSDVEMRIEWWKNGDRMADNQVMRVESKTFDVSAKRGSDFTELFFESDVEPGDYIGARVHLILSEPTIPPTADAELDITVEEFRLNFLRLTEDSTISFQNYPKFKNFKWLDLLRGEIDLFDLEIQTDPVRKEVYIEPRHSYTLPDGTPHAGYFNREVLDFSQKRDISQEDQLILFSDFEREFVFQFREDAQDGGLKKVQDRNQAVIGKAKYVLPERFKTGDPKPKENRFYSALMHYEHDQWRYITGVAPQLPCIIPENIANTSSEAAENTFQPKRAWYKGKVTGAGGWKFNGSVRNDLPFMFAVNYKAGSELDPVLSYADQQIGGIAAPGLLRKFFLQRMAIYRHGRKWEPMHLRLNNSDVTNFLHRESIVIEGVEYLLTGIKGYNPLSDDSTECTLWMFMPAGEVDAAAVYPSAASVQGTAAAQGLDIKFWPHRVLSSDIP